MDNHYDYIIVGTGCAGLSLAYHMAQSKVLNKRRVLLLDNQTKSTNDKTWCFWAESQQPYTSSQEVSWRNLVFKADSLNVKEELPSLSYYHINSLSFYKETIRKVKEHDNFVLRRLAVDGIEQTGDLIEVTAGKNKFTASFVFNSVISLINKKPSKPALWQHFYGKKIRTVKKAFKDNSVKLMDFSLPNRDTVQFGYVLPFSDREALVEYTEFSPETRSDSDYEVHFKQYATTLDLGEYEILEAEKGQIPMSEFQFPRYNSSRVLNLGTSGGFTKPTTGYTFKNIQDDVQSIIHSLEQEEPFKRPYTKSRFRFYDRLLLGIIKDEPEKVKGIMIKLFKNNSMERVLTFLDERSTLIEEAKIFMRLPWAPFLKQLFLK